MNFLIVIIRKNNDFEKFQERIRECVDNSIKDIYQNNESSSIQLAELSQSKLEKYRAQLLNFAKVNFFFFFFRFFLLPMFIQHAFLF